MYLDIDRKKGAKNMNRLAINREQIVILHTAYKHEDIVNCPNVVEISDLLSNMQRSFISSPDLKELPVEDSRLLKGIQKLAALAIDISRRYEENLALSANVATNREVLSNRQASRFGADNLTKALSSILDIHIDDQE